ncbi:MAG: SRPBCC domain-containing protein [Thermoplasmata archaeon]|nr:SRPBCC domain-containing protein [Thermoplasmata archaeon]
MPEPDTRTVDHQYFIRASPETVFRAITDPKWLVRWLADTAELEARKGGNYLLGWNAGPTHRGTVLEFEPGNSLALSWEWEGVEVQGTVFSLAVEPQDDGTIFQVEHTGFPRREEWTDLYGGAEWGWTYFAMNLKSVLENGHDLRAKEDG